MKKGKQDSCELLAALLDGVSGRTENGRILLAAPKAGRGLADVFEGTKKALADRHSRVELSMAEGLVDSAEALDRAKEAGAVFLFVMLDQDSAEDTHQAFANLSVVGAGLYGYIAGVR